jgi:hypothetical protein
MDFQIVQIQNTKTKYAGLEITGCQWPKAGHILEMAGKKI